MYDIIDISLSPTLIVIHPFITKAFIYFSQNLMVLIFIYELKVILFVLRSSKYTMMMDVKSI